MNESHHTTLLMEFLASEAYLSGRQSVQEFLAEHPECSDAWLEIKAGWETMDKDVQRIPAVRGSFTSVLEEYKQEQRPAPSAKTITFTIPRWTIAAACGILGLAIGLMWPQQSMNPQDQAVTSLMEELEQTQLAMQVLLLQSPNASERMRAVSMTKEYPPVGDTRNAWLRALEEDPNVNVRMAALDVLTRDGKTDRLADQLLEAMPYQESPMMRLTMSELMTNWNIKEATPIMESWLEDPFMPANLRTQIEAILQEFSPNHQRPRL